MRSQVRGLNRAGANAQDGISFIQTTEGYLQESQNILQRIRELSVQAANGIYTSEDRQQIQVEVSQLVAEVDRIASHAQFNGSNMLTGRFANQSTGGKPMASMWFHVGANMDQRVQAFVGTMTATGLGIKSGESRISLSTPAGANTSIGIIDKALTKVSKQRADLGAYQNRLDSVVRSVAIGAENIQASESRIRDANMANEMSKLAKDQILTQASVSMLAQANVKSQGVLKLLG
jgi:flagellin